MACDLPSVHKLEEDGAEWEADSEGEVCAGAPMAGDKGRAGKQGVPGDLRAKQVLPPGDGQGTAPRQRHGQVPVPCQRAEAPEEEAGPPVPGRDDPQAEEPGEGRERSSRAQHSERRREEEEGSEVMLLVPVLCLFQYVTSLNTYDRSERQLKR